MADYLDQPRTFNDALELVPGASVQFYVTGTENPTPVYNGLDIRVDSDGNWVYDLSAALPNPVKSDGAARLPLMFRDPNVVYRMVMSDPDGNELHDIDPFTRFPGPEVFTPLTDSGAAMPEAVLTVYLSQTSQVVEQLTADEDGEFDAVDLEDDVVYRAALHNANGELVYDIDPYPGDGSSVVGGGGPASVLYVNPMIFTAGAGMVVTPLLGLNSADPSIGAYISGGFGDVEHYTVGDYTGGISPTTGFEFFVDLDPGVIPTGPIFDSVYITELDITLYLVDAVIQNTGNITEYVWAGNIGIVNGNTYTLVFSGGAQ